MDSIILIPSWWFLKLFIGYASRLFTDLLKTSTLSLSDSFVNSTTESKARSYGMINLLSLNLFSVMGEGNEFGQLDRQQHWLTFSRNISFRHQWKTYNANHHRLRVFCNFLSTLHRIFGVTFLNAGEAISEWNREILISHWIWLYSLDQQTNLTVSTRIKYFHFNLNISTFESSILLSYTSCCNL